MQILMIAHAFSPTFGGIESHLWDISTRLAKRGHDIYALWWFSANPDCRFFDCQASGDIQLEFNTFIAWCDYSAGIRSLALREESIFAVYQDA
jgi:hypothetical protein